MTATLAKPARARKTGSPIYDGLVEERGDVAAEAAEAAERLRRTAGEVLRCFHPAPDPEREPAGRG